MRRPRRRKHSPRKSRRCCEREKRERASDQLPDRLSIDPKSPYYNEAVLARDVGIRFKGVEKTNVEEYCVSEGWVRVTAGNAKDRYGNPLTIKVHGPVEPYFRDKARPELFRSEPDANPDGAIVARASCNLEWIPPIRHTVDGR